MNAGKTSRALKTKSRQSLVKRPKKQIKTKEAYDLVMREIDELTKKGEEHLSEKEQFRLGKLVEAAEWFEDAEDPLPLPEGLPDIIRMRMYQMQLNQTLVARLLGISDTKFSLIMSGKQKPDINFLKAVHSKLQVDANRILQAI